MLTSLFGGALAVVLLFFLLGLARLPVYWRGVVSAGALLVAYGVSAVRAWPGLDAVTMHVAVYVSTAIILSLLASRYAAHPGKLHWIPKLFIGFFVGVLALNALFLYIASHGLPPAVARWVLPRASEGGVHSAFPGVVPHAGDAARGVRAHLRQQDRQARLNWDVAAEGFDALTPGASAELTVRARDGTGAPLADARVELALFRPAHTQPAQVFRFAPHASGTYRGVVRIEQGGEWLAVLRIQRGQDLYELQRPLHLSGRP